MKKLFTELKDAFKNNPELYSKNKELAKCAKVLRSIDSKVLSKVIDDYGCAVVDYSALPSYSKKHTEAYSTIVDKLIRLEPGQLNILTEARAIFNHKVLWKVYTNKVLAIILDVVKSNIKDDFIYVSGFANDDGVVIVLDSDIRDIRPDSIISITRGSPRVTYGLHKENISTCNRINDVYTLVDSMKTAMNKDFASNIMYSIDYTIEKIKQDIRISEECGAITDTRMLGKAK